MIALKIIGTIPVSKLGNFLDKHTVSAIVSLCDKYLFYYKYEVKEEGIYFGILPHIYKVTDKEVKVLLEDILGTVPISLTTATNDLDSDTLALILESPDGYFSEEVESNLDDPYFCEELYSIRKSKKEAPWKEERSK